MTIHNVQNRRSGKPAIMIGKTDHERLSNLATDSLDRMPSVADELLGELERARIVRPEAIPANVVTMGSVLEYRADTGQQRQVTLVYPAEADIAAGKVSILTPIGTALIGLSEGQSIEWTARDARVHRLTVLSVKQPVAVEQS